MIVFINYKKRFFLGKLEEEFDTHYNGVPLVNDKSQWEKSIYKTKLLKPNEGTLDCGFLCKDVEKSNGCNFIFVDDQICYFGKSSHTKGTIDLDLLNITIFITEGKRFTFTTQQNI